MVVWLSAHSGDEGMRKYKYKVVENYIKIFKKVNDEVYLLLSKKDADIDGACVYLEKIQQKAIELGEFIEKEEPEVTSVIKTLEDFCELLYEIHEELLSERGLSAGSAKGRLEHGINVIENTANADIALQQVAVFLPYKASMWDSLESVWLAARSDVNCETYVIPIPYYDRNPDRTFGTMHYEGDLLPDYVPITSYEEFDFGKMHPDLIFVHNPYDQYNFVTSIHPFFYSYELKKYTECLVYIPYFATTGGMGDPQGYSPSFDVFNYIVVQSNSLKDYYKNIDKAKLLPLGSPKFDSVIKHCQNPPEPPEGWKEKMAGRKVYFYNTSLNGMLTNPLNFMKKMVYVFDTFREREDACLLWRPHPLFESTLESMVPDVLQIYKDIRDKFIDEGWGIYDTTPSIEDTIALCDVYIGDTGSSVPSLFGVAGKPIFVLNNNINELPNENDWKANVWQMHLNNYRGDTFNKHCIVAGKELFWSPNDDMHFEFYCDLPADTYPFDYGRAIEYKGRVVLIPMNAQDFLLIDKNRKIKKVPLDKKMEAPGAFRGYLIDRNYIFLLPNKYPFMVRFDMDKQELTYLTNVGEFNIFRTEDNLDVPAATWDDASSIYMLSATGEELLIIDKKSMEIEKIPTGFAGVYWGAEMERVGADEVWLNPFEGSVWKKYNFKTGASRDVNVKIEGFTGFDRFNKTGTHRWLYSSIAFNGDEMIFAPYWGNKFISMDRKTGVQTEWESPFECGYEDKSQYQINDYVGRFIHHLQNDTYSYEDYINRKYYSIDLNTKEAILEEQFFDKDEVISHSLGYANQARNLIYMCMENEVNTLIDLLNDTIIGNKHSAEEQIEEYKKINASPAGDCGEKVYEYLK